MSDNSQHLAERQVTEPPRLLKIHEVAAILGRSRSQTYEDCAAGRIGGVVHIGSSVRVLNTVFYRWLEQAAGDGGAR